MLIGGLDKQFRYLEVCFCDAIRFIKRWILEVALDPALYLIKKYKKVT